MTRVLPRLAFALALGGPIAWTPALAQEPPTTSTRSLLQQNGFVTAPATIDEPSADSVASEASESPAPAAGALVESLRSRIEAQQDQLEQLEAELKRLKAPAKPKPIVMPVAAADLAAVQGGREAMYGNVSAAPGEVVEELLALSGDVHVYGTVTGNATTLNGHVYIHDGGKVLGDAMSLTGDVQIDPGGVLQGESITLNGNTSVRPGGAIHGAAMPVIEPQNSWVGGLLMSLYRRLVFLLAFAGAGVLIVTLFQDRVRNISAYLEQNPARAGLMGLAWTAGLTIASVLFFWTVLGPLAAAAVLGLAWMLGFVGLCQMIGDRLGLPSAQQGQARWLTFLIGAVLISFLGALPWIGILVVLGASIFGMGAALQTSFGTKQAA
ncbi:MAG: hypothetical protein AB8H79_20205 [Myxococcota bacterium]